MHDILDIEADAFRRIVAEHLGEGAVGVNHAAFDPDQHHADGGILHDIAKQRLALLEAHDLRVGMIGLHRLGHAGRHTAGILRSLCHIAAILPPARPIG